MPPTHVFQGGKPAHMYESHGEQIIFAKETAHINKYRSIQLVRCRLKPRKAKRSGDASFFSVASSDDTSSTFSAAAGSACPSNSSSQACCTQTKHINAQIIDAHALTLTLHLVEGWPKLIYGHNLKHVEGWTSLIDPHRSDAGAPTSLADFERVAHHRLAHCLASRRELKRETSQRKIKIASLQANLFANNACTCSSDGATAAAGSGGGHVCARCSTSFTMLALILF